MANKKFWKGKKVLVTGHTGFKGSWLSIWLQSMGADVIGYSLDNNTSKDNYVLASMSEKITDIRGDIRDKNRIESVVDEYKPEILFHLAAQPLVLTSYEKTLETYETNVMGTVNILEVIRKCNSIKEAILITTDKVYENKETIRGYVETDSLGGYDPYSASKACDEIIISSYRNSFFNIDKYNSHGKAIASVRAGNVIGGGDWSDNRIVPDCIRALEVGEPIVIRNKESVRPWQHVLEPLNGYLTLAEKMWKEPQKYSGAYNFGPKQDGIWSVWDVASELVNCYGMGEMKAIINPDKPHEANLLTLDISKAEKILGWTPRLDTKTAIMWTAKWYKEYKERDVYEICLEQILKYMEK